MVNEGIQKEVLRKLTINSSREGEMYYKFLAVERYLNEVCHIRDGQILRYTVPYNENFLMSVRMREGRLSLYATNAHEHNQAGIHDSTGDLYEQCKALEAIKDST